MTDKKLKNAFRQAAELAAGVPEEMREIAFNRALDLLLGVSRERHEESAGHAPHAQRSSEKALEQYLRLVNMATGVIGVEALTAKQIAKVMEDRFGVRADSRMVSTALDSADFVVDRVTQGGEVLYRLVNPARLLRRPAKPAPHAKKKAPHKRPQPKKPASAVEILNDLLAKGFFNSARTIGEILMYLERKGLQFTATQLYPILMKLIKAGLLDREKSTDGEYEYHTS